MGHSSSDIVLFKKIAEGGSNRVFEVTFKAGLKVIARLPYPSTIPKNYGVASEVATMEFLRLYAISIPKIYSWSSMAANPVGSEYIIMERIEGRALADTWLTMTVKERINIMEQIVKMEKILFGIRFPANGSLFFSDSLCADIKRVEMPRDNGVKDVDKFCIGPSTEYLWWYRKRDELTANRGPCKYTPLQCTMQADKSNSGKSSEELLRSAGEREKIWLEKFAKKRYPREPLFREFYGNQEVEPQVRINHLSDYLKLVTHLVPEGEEFNAPAIRHPDLSPSNILIRDSGDIAGIIDWQHTAVLPLFLQAKIPQHYQNWGDEDSENLRSPELPKGFDGMAEEDKEYELERYRNRVAHYLYVGLSAKYNTAHYRAFVRYNIQLRSKLYDIACQPWEGDNTSLQAQLIRTMANWDEIVDSPKDTPPLELSFSAKEKDECLERAAKQDRSYATMQAVRNAIGMSVDGWVSNTEFEAAKERARLAKVEMAKATETEDGLRECNELWPFQDHEEID